jgi:hypothetical protein
MGKLLLVIAGVVLISGGYLYVHQNAFKNKWEIDTRSPGGNYRVHIQGKTEPPSRSYYKHGNHRVEFSVFKQEQSFIMKEPLYEGDEYDDLFLDLYSPCSWLSESVLRCGQGDLAGTTQHDEIDVTNNGKHEVDYLRVNLDGFQMFIVLDLGPSQEAVLLTLPQTEMNRDRSAMTYWGKRSGQTIQGGAAFDIRGKYKGPAHYLINLTDDGVAITSREFLPAR